jgi:hypothetical protein
VVLIRRKKIENAMLLAERRKGNKMLRKIFPVPFPFSPTPSLLSQRNGVSFKNFAHPSLFALK